MLPAVGVDICDAAVLEKDCDPCHCACNILDILTVILCGPMAFNAAEPVLRLVYIMEECLCQRPAQIQMQGFRITSDMHGSESSYFRGSVRHYSSEHHYYV